MDSQTFGTLAAAVITATAGLAGVALTRRTSFSRHMRQEIRDDIEMLSILPADHPMHAELSNVIEARLRGYTRLFDHSLRHEPSLGRPFIVSASGVLLTLLVPVFDDWFGTSAFLGDLFAGRVDWISTSREHIIGSIGANAMLAGLFLYIFGVLSYVQSSRIRVWRRAMRGDAIEDEWPDESDTADAK